MSIDLVWVESGSCPVEQDLKDISDGKAVNIGHKTSEKKWLLVKKVGT